MRQNESRGSASRAVLLAGVLLLLPTAGVAQTPDLWGIDEDDGQLFRIEDYDGTPLFTDFGNLSWNAGGNVQEIGSDIESATLAPDGMLFMAIDGDLGPFLNPVLLTFDLADASTSAPNVVDLIGGLGVVVDDPSDNLSGLSLDPLTGSMWAVLKDEGETDELWFIPDPLNAPGTAAKLGDLTGASGTVIRAEDLEFDELGNLFVADDRSNEEGTSNQIWQIQLERDSATDEILGILDVTSFLDIGFGNKPEALGWDFQNDRLVGSDDDSDRFFEATASGLVDLGALGSGSELTDVEGIDFVPLGEGPPPMAPEPGALSLVGLSLLALGLRQRAGPVGRRCTPSKS